MTYVLARDCYSGRITAGAVMSQKNNITIYDEVYLPTIVEDGLWDQVIVDYGREFYLVLYIQEKLRLNVAILNLFRIGKQYLGQTM